MDSIRIALVEDDPAFQELLGLYITNQDDLELVGTASNGQEALQLAAARRPQVFLMDLNMPVMDGIEATERILASYPETKIIAITTFDHHDYVSRALAAGVHGYLLKNSRPREVKQAIRAALEERAIIDQRALASLVISMNLEQEPAQEDTWEKLTSTEQKFVKLVCRGYTNQEIAGELNYSISTVKNSLSEIYRKLGVKSRTQLLVEAGYQNFPVLDD